MPGTVPRPDTFVLFYLLIHCRLCRLPVAPAKLSARCSARDLGQHRTIRREPVARDFSSAESLENRGILGVFPVFQTVRMGEKTRHPAADAFVRCCLRFHAANWNLARRAGGQVVRKICVVVFALRRSVSFCGTENWNLAASPN